MSSQTSNIICTLKSCYLEVYYLFSTLDHKIVFNDSLFLHKVDIAKKKVGTMLQNFSLPVRTLQDRVNSFLSFCKVQNMKLKQCRQFHIITSSYCFLFLLHHNAQANIKRMNRLE
jgi:hypothetical protein